MDAKTLEALRLIFNTSASFLDDLSMMILCDFYKISHRPMYPDKMQLVYSTWTPRASRMKGVEHVVWIGGQVFFKEFFVDLFEKHFFSKPKAKVIAQYKRVIKYTLGVENPDTSHLEALHDLGYMPLSAKALPEGTLVPLRVPVMTVHNTKPEFFWLTNFVESLASSELWQISTSATISLNYRRLMDKYSMETVGNTDFVQFQGHDFSFRGMSSLRSAILSGMGHLAGGFVGTDTIPCISAAEYYYLANIEKELVGTSIPATEHSVQCCYANDLDYFRRMINVVHPSGFVSIVSDGYDFWDVIGRVIPTLKSDILARKGGPIGDRVVIRPDSGDPVLIVCGDPDAPEGSLERKGAIEALWDIFGGSITEKGYRLLDPHIGLIYGDAITLRRAEEIMERLKAKGFASINVVFGIGSYTYQYNTRDTFGYALKSTLCVIDGKEKQIFKDPKTDSGIKKSQKGRVVVLKDGNSFKFMDGFGLNDNIVGDQLGEFFRDGKFLKIDQWSDVKARIASAK